MIKTYRDLIVWQKAMIAVKAVYVATKNFPSDERHALVPQMRRAAVSIPSNIAEGFGKIGNDFKRHLCVAQGSLFELQTQVEIADSLEYLQKEQALLLKDRLTEVERLLSSLINKLKIRKTLTLPLCRSATLPLGKQ